MGYGSDDEDPRLDGDLPSVTEVRAKTMQLSTLPVILPLRPLGDPRPGELDSELPPVNTDSVGHLFTGEEPNPPRLMIVQLPPILPLQNEEVQKARKTLKGTLQRER